MKEVFKELMDSLPMSMKIIGIFVILCFIFLGICAHRSCKMPAAEEKPFSFLSDL